VHVIQSERGASLEHARAEAVTLVNRYAEDIAAMGEEFTDQDARCAAALRGFLDGLRQWQRGNIDSSLEGARYRAAESTFRELRGTHESAG
jgi:hypothetical protein